MAESPNHWRAAVHARTGTMDDHAWRVAASGFPAGDDETAFLTRVQLGF